MTENPAVIQAKFEHGILVIVQASPELSLPAHKTVLNIGLEMASSNGWRVLNANFEGFNLNVTFEKVPQPHGRPFVYLIQRIEETGNSLPVADKQFIEKTSEPIRQNGWKRLAISQPLKGLACGTCVISFWAK